MCEYAEIWENISQVTRSCQWWTRIRWRCLTISRRGRGKCEDKYNHRWSQNINIIYGKGQSINNTSLTKTPLKNQNYRPAFVMQFMRSWKVTEGQKMVTWNNKTSELSIFYHCTVMRLKRTSILKALPVEIDHKVYKKLCLEVRQLGDWGNFLWCAWLAPHIQYQWPVQDVRIRISSWTEERMHKYSEWKWCEIPTGYAQIERIACHLLLRQSNHLAISCRDTYLKPSGHYISVCGRIRWMWVIVGPISGNRVKQTVAHFHCLLLGTGVQRDSTHSREKARKRYRGWSWVR